MIDFENSVGHRAMKLLPRKKKQCKRKLLKSR